MLKRLAILGLLLAAIPPMPGQAVKPAAQSGDAGQNESQGNQTTPAPAPSLVNKPEQPPAADPTSGRIAPEDKEHSIKLTNLPPITLTDKRKTFWDHVLDWGPWIADFLLVGVGGLQVWLLLRTWQTIERQADIQAAGMKQWVEVQPTSSECETYYILGGIEYKAEKINIWFSALNHTDYPLTIQEIFVKISGHRSDGPQWKPYTRKEEIILSPGKGKEPEVGKMNPWEYRFVVTINLDAPMEKAYKNRQLFCSVSGHVFFKPVVGPPEKQWFGCLTMCGPSWASVCPQGSILNEIQETGAPQNPS